MSQSQFSVPIWPVGLSTRLPVVGTVGLCPTVYLMGRGPIPSRRSFARRSMRSRGVARYQPRFPAVVPVEGAGCPRVTQPFATRFPSEEGVPFDLHVLGAPPAFILSQDRTLRSNDIDRPRDPALRRCAYFGSIGAISASRLACRMTGRFVRLLVALRKRSR